MTETGAFTTEMIGQAASLEAVLVRTRRVAPTDCTVLVSGETGTGKELLARTLHLNSPRRNKPFVAVNCAAMSKDLLESELFGHVQGAFTSAMRNREGRFQLADGGTIFLDEIGEIPLDLQGKLLRVLQFKEFSAVGESKVRKVDVRIIAATNADLQQMSVDGTFRSDLFYRLNVVQLKLPPLRERLSDVEALVDHFVAKSCERYGREITGISDEAMSSIRGYAWPGNIRELENAVEHAVLMSLEDVIAKEDLPPFQEMSGDGIADFVRPLSDEGIDLQQTLRQIEAHYINQALQQTDGNKNQAANLLGLNRTTLVEKLKRGLPQAVASAV